ncbi:putative MFS polyamine transporter [Aspergillus melleus]|uniref:putative MFS polyamine transporter n=1 Tax=Aspergillus melleus TaxID=138277 RepID=UPI001E8EB1D0|nr:uncharacterized protein LDX57_013051 [Aspergillus melleus]KAH8435421.1 hypothetical protein LDX57_013051 [Aspergillus melleus]
MEYFSVGRTAAISNITLYTVGLACGPLLLAPLSEMYGRRWVYIVASSCLLAFTAGAAVAGNLATFLVCRFLGGFLGSVGIAIGAGTVVDLWPAGQQRGAASLLFVLGPFLAPSIAPIVGAYAMTAHDGDWRWTEWVTLFIGIPIWLLVILMQETSKPMPMHQGDNVVVTGGQVDNRLRAICLPFKMLCNDWIVLSLTLHTAFGYAIIFSYFTSILYVLSSAYQFDAKKASLSLLSLVIGYFCAIIMCVHFDKRFCPRNGTGSMDHVPPEKRLYAGMVGSILMLLGEVWYALAARQGGHWAVVVAAGIPLGWGVFALFVSAAPVRNTNIQ